VMEYVDGVNLRQAMRSGRFSSREALAIVPSICEALQYAHEQGVLHRDIKPENILLDARGRVKIADFGIAKLVGDQSADFTLTASGVRLGTPHYMAPEQVESPSEVDHRADIYSLGVVFYELLTGELPLGRFAPPSTKADLDARVDEIVLRALAKERELRQQSAGEVKTQVEGIQTQATPAYETPPGGTPGPTTTTAPRSSVRLAPEHQSYALLGMGALLVVLLADFVPLLRASVGTVGSFVGGSGPMGWALGIAALGFVTGVARLAWLYRTILLEPFGVLTLPGSQGTAVCITANALYTVLAARLALQGVAYGGLLLGTLGWALRSNPVFSLVAILALIVLGLQVHRRSQQPDRLQPPTSGPSWLVRTAWLFLAGGAVSLLPTLLSWESNVRVWTPGACLVVVGIALLTRQRAWRTLSLAICWSLLIAGVLLLALTPSIAAARDPLVELRVVQGGSGILNVLGWMEWLAFIAALIVLQRQDVRAAFGLLAPPTPVLRPNPWPHRLFWLIVGTLALVASAMVSGLLVPALQRTQGDTALLLGPALPFGVGALLVWLFRRTRPNAAQARPVAEWNPWPKRIFVAVVGVVLIPGFLLALGLILPQVAARQARTTPNDQAQFGLAPGIPPLPVPIPIPATEAETPTPPVFPSRGVTFTSSSHTAFGFEREGTIVWLLLLPTEKVQGNLQGNERGSLIAGEISLGYHRDINAAPETLWLGSSAFDLKQGRLFAMDPSGQIRQINVTPRYPNDETFGEIMEQAGLGNLLSEPFAPSGPEASTKAAVPPSSSLPRDPGNKDRSSPEIGQPQSPFLLATQFMETKEFMDTPVAPAELEGTLTTGEGDSLTAEWTLSSKQSGTLSVNYRGQTHSLRVSPSGRMSDSAGVLRLTLVQSVLIPGTVVALNWRSGIHTNITTLHLDSLPSVSAAEISERFRTNHAIRIEPHQPVTLTSLDRNPITLVWFPGVLRADQLRPVTF